MFPILAASAIQPRHRSTPARPLATSARQRLGNARHSSPSRALSPAAAARRPPPAARRLPTRSVTRRARSEPKAPRTTPAWRGSRKIGASCHLEGRPALQRPRALQRHARRPTHPLHQVASDPDRSLDERRRKVVESRRRLDAESTLAFGPLTLRCYSTRPGLSLIIRPSASVAKQMAETRASPPRTLPYGPHRPPKLGAPVRSSRPIVPLTAR